MGGFSGALGSLWVEVGAKIQKFESAMADVSKQIDSTVKDAEKKFAGFDKLGDQLKGIGVGLTAAVTLPLVGIGVASAKLATDFQSAMNKVSALGEVTGKDLENLKAVAIDLGAKTKFSATEAAQGMAELSAAGLNANKVLAALPAVLDLAAAGEMSIARAAEITTDALTQFGLEANQSAHVADVMAKAAADSKTNVTELGVALGYAGTPAKAFGLSIEQTAAAIEVMANAGIRGERAGTALRSILVSLAKPTDEAAKLLAHMGVKLTDAAGQMLPLSNIVDQLTKKNIGLAEAAILVGEQGATGLLALKNKGGPALEALSAGLVKADGDVKRMALTLQTGLPGALEKAKGSIETAGIVIGTALAPTIVKLAGFVEAAANKIAEFAGWFQKLSEPVKTAALAFVALVAAIGPMLVIAGTLIGSLGGLAAGFAVLSGPAGVALLTAALSTAAVTTAVFLAAWAGWEVLKSIGDSLHELIPSFNGLQSVLDMVLAPVRVGKVAFESLGISVSDLQKTVTGLAQSGAFGVLGVAISKLEFGKVTLSWEDFKRAVISGLGPLGALSELLRKIAELKGLITGTFSSMDEAVVKVARSSTDASLGMMKISESALKAQASTAGLITGQNKASTAAIQHSKALKTLVSSSDTATTSHKKHAAGLTHLEKEAKKTADAADDLAKAFNALGVKGDSTDIKQWTDALAKVEVAFKQGKVSAGDWAKAQTAAFEKLNKGSIEFDKLIERMNATKNLGHLQSFFPPEWFAAVQRAREELEKAQAGMIALQNLQQGTAGIAWVKAANSDFIKLNETIERSGGAQLSLGEKVQQISQDYNVLASNIGKVGVTEEMVLKKQSELLHAQIALAKSQGQNTTELDNQLGVVNKSLDLHGEKVKGLKSIWGDWAKQVSTIINDVSKNIVDRFIKAGDINKKLDEDAAKLKESLAGREQTYTEFADNVATTLADIHADYESDLANDEETLRESLDERRKDYADYAADIADNLVKFTKQNAKNADKERRALEDSLEDRTRDYDDYVGDVEDRIRDIRSGHARSVATETQNLNESLADRKTDYDRYVEDVGIRLARIRAQNKGQFSEEEADLLLSLKRRTEDFQAFQTETITRIGEVAAKHKLEEEQQVKDQQEALARRTRDFNLYRDEIAANLAEVTAKHKEAQEQEEADLAASLAKKKAELEKFEADLATQFEGRRADALAKLQKQEADLTASLEKQRAEWEKYKNDIAVQLQEIEDKHLGIFGKIAEVGKGIFADIGAAVARFVTEELVGKLFKELTKLAVDILPSLGKTMTAIFGGGSGLAVQVPDWVSGVGGIPGAAGGAAEAAGGAASAAGGIAGGAGQAAGAATSGITAIVGAVAAVGSLISGVFGNFQMAAMNKVLDLIEGQVRRGAQYLGDRGDGGIVSASLKAVEYLGYITATGDTIGKKLDEWLEPCKNNLVTIRESIPLMQTRLDSIANYTQYGSQADKDNTSALHQLRELFTTIGARQPLIQVYINQVPVAASAVSMKLQGSLIL